MIFNSLAGRHDREESLFDLLNLRVEKYSLGPGIQLDILFIWGSNQAGTPLYHDNTTSTTSPFLKLRAIDLSVYTLRSPFLPPINVILLLIDQIDIHCKSLSCCISAALVNSFYIFTFSWAIWHGLVSRSCEVYIHLWGHVMLLIKFNSSWAILENTWKLSKRS